MKQTIEVAAVPMTEERMQFLEDQGKIIRLTPEKYLQDPGRNQTLVDVIYQSAPKYGPHMLIAVTVNRFEFSGFGTHDDNEEFILVGNPDSKVMYLAVALCSKEELDEKIRSKTLESEDFMMLKVKYNDPAVSFFVMLKDIPHGEATIEGDGTPPTFYVTEPLNQTMNVTNFGDFELRAI